LGGIRAVEQLIARETRYPRCDTERVFSSQAYGPSAEAATL
jgi:hypothetical protein